MALDDWFTSSSVRYIPPGMIVDYLTNKLRKETPEEHVRQRVVRSIVEEYDYDKNQIELEFRVYVGSKSYPVDVAIFNEDIPHRQENIYIIVETKKESVTPESENHGIGQLISYLQMAINSEFGMWTNGVEKRCYQKVLKDDKFEISEILDIPPKGKSLEEFEKLDFSQLRPAIELESVFKRCHNYIHGNQGLPKDIAFHELLKVIFCKVYNERESGMITFYVTNKELKSSIGQLKVKERIENIFKEVKTRYSHIFKKDENIELHPRVLAYIIGQLQHFSLLHTETDVKGEAYEAIVGANLKGDRGEFFTPRNVCEMAVESLFHTYPSEKWHMLKIIDPACGTGGFLVAIINFIKKFFIEQENKKSPDEFEAITHAQNRVKDFCEENLYGIDFNPLLVRASQMNEVMHGNGSGNLFSENSLIPLGEWDDETQKKVDLESFDLLFTNPPFGSKIPIDDPHTLSQYDLGYTWRRQDKNEFNRTNKLKKSVPPEQLFIERCLQLLKPHGKMAIVLPDSILSNPSLRYIRYWILRKTRIIASIDLPREAFQPYVGTKTSVLFLEKKSNEEIRMEEISGGIKPYDVFMSIAENIGHDKRGNKIYKRSPEGEVIIIPREKEVIRLEGKQKIKETRVMQTPIVYDDLPTITLKFREWIKQS